MQASRYSTLVLPVDNPQAFLTAVSLLRSGEVIAFPTDTVYGVGCDLWQPAAVERIYRIKQRPLNMAIPLLVAGMSSVQQVSCNLGSTFFLLAEAFLAGRTHPDCSAPAFCSRCCHRRRRYGCLADACLSGGIGALRSPGGSTGGNQRQSFRFAGLCNGRRGLAGPWRASPTHPGWRPL